LSPILAQTANLTAGHFRLHIFDTNSQYLKYSAMHKRKHANG